MAAAVAALVEYSLLIKTLKPDETSLPNIYMCTYASFVNNKHR